MKKIIHTPLAPAPVGPYNQAVLVGPWLYISGQIAIDPASGTLITRTIEEETHQVLSNLKVILGAAGMDFSHVVKCSVFVKDLDHYGIINSIYGEYFGIDQAPARELVQVSRLPKDVNLEISAIAYSPSAS